MNMVVFVLMIWSSHTNTLYPTLEFSGANAKEKCETALIQVTEEKIKRNMKLFSSNSPSNVGTCMRIIK
jgi:hypothetical protein